MSKWFDGIASSENPGREVLKKFVSQVTNFLGDVLDQRYDFRFLWEDDTDLLQEAKQTYTSDVLSSSRKLQSAITKAKVTAIKMHGLQGQPLRFKLRVVESIARRWDAVRGQFSIRGWLKQMFDAIDAVLDSIIDAAGGAGGLIKEFKDALSALVPTA